MRPLSLLLALAFSAVCSICVAADLPEIELWPQGMPEPVVPADMPEKVEMGKDGISRRHNISKPRLFVHLPPDGTPRSKAAVIVIPGGGFGILADGHEGADCAQWLAKQGIAAFQLAHRTPTNKHTEPNAGPVQDAQKAVSEVRKRASEFGIDPQQIGILGFSAGGQVTLVAATNELRFPVSGELASHKANFLLLLYPYKIYDPATKALRADIKLDSGLPPTFIAQMGDDGASVPQGSALLYLELINRKIPAEIHIYEKGGHGFGMLSRPNATGPTDWRHRAADWLKLHGYVVQP